MATYDPKNPFGWLYPPLGNALTLGVAPKPTTRLADLLAPTPPTAIPESPYSPFGSLAPSSNPFSLAGVAPLPVSPPGPTLLGGLGAFGVPPPTPLARSWRDELIERSAEKVKRKAFFSFHYDDIMRVNVVRNAWKIDHPDNALMRSFYDSSLWESKKLDGDEAVKRLIREGVDFTSSVCVLVGSDTWLRRWVKYEIARAIVDGRGLLAVHLNSIRHHKTLTPHMRGYNPLDYMAVGKIQATLLSEPKYFLFEKLGKGDAFRGYHFEWHRYGDYTNSVNLPPWLDDPQPGYVTPLSYNCAEYDYIADNGHKNIGAWIDLAASKAGR
jgi:hypothetical protein